MALVLASPSLGKTYKPNKTSDHAPGSCSKSDCTLREAITAANSHGGADKLVLRGGKRYKLAITPQGANDNATGDLNVLGDLTITHSGRRAATVDARGTDRVFKTEAKVTLKGLKITGGKSTGGGAGVLGVGGHLTVISSEVTKNRGPNGTGVEATGSVPTKLTISKSTVSANKATVGDGGGVGVYSGSSATITSSTIAGNTAKTDGGGIVVGGIVKLTNSTITENKASGSGGGIEVSPGAAMELNAVTIARNTANSDATAEGSGGGVHSGLGSTSSIKNSLLGLNSLGALSIPLAEGPNCNEDGAGGLVSNGHNLVGDEAGCEGVFVAAGDRAGRSSGQVGIEKLSANGGPTETVGLKKTSQAINHGGAGAPAKDQRGRKRKGKPDIGAFERT